MMSPWDRVAESLSTRETAADTVTDSHGYSPRAAQTGAECHFASRPTALIPSPSPWAGDRGTEDSLGWAVPVWPRTRAPDAPCGGTTWQCIRNKLDASRLSPKLLKVPSQRGSGAPKGSDRRPAQATVLALALARVDTESVWALELAGRVAQGKPCPRSR